MRTLSIAVVTIACGFGRAAFASNFCDDHPVAPSGAGSCHQTRSAVVDPGPVFERQNNGPHMLPDYSDYDMRLSASAFDTPLTYLIDVSRLAAAPASAEREIAILELGIHQSQWASADPGDTTGDRVLAATFVRHANGAWALRMDWLQAAADWSIVDGDPTGVVELGSAMAEMPAQVTQMGVTIVPSNGWAHLAITVAAFPPAPSFLPQLRLADVYTMPHRGSAAQNQPVRLRSGVLGGDLRGASEETQYWFVSPVIED